VDGLNLACQRKVDSVGRSFGWFDKITDEERRDALEQRVGMIRVSCVPACFAQGRRREHRQHHID
jgi:hypothetical protein